MKESRKKWWIRLDPSGRPVNGTLINVEFAPRLAEGLGRYVMLDTALQLCCVYTTTTTTTSTSTSTTTSTTTL